MDSSIGCGEYDPLLVLSLPGLNEYLEECLRILLGVFGHHLPDELGGETRSFGPVVDAHHWNALAGQRSGYGQAIGAHVDHICTR
ncbi:MAG: hypothetical protein A4E31_01303 [Methanomassiliicoccales archaeon PtaU1.Bin030]|nr:MAG: hypothetical protein A4E31_01303 [Methanomassiliicoccales archaeon PtaU1.Bin030]